MTTKEQDDEDEALFLEMEKAGLVEQYTGINKSGRSFTDWRLTEKGDAWGSALYGKHMAQVMLEDYLASQEEHPDAS